MDMVADGLESVGLDPCGTQRVIRVPPDRHGRTQRQISRVILDPRLWVTHRMMRRAAPRDTRQGDAHGPREPDATPRIDTR